MAWISSIIALNWTILCNFRDAVGTDPIFVLHFIVGQAFFQICNLYRSIYLFQIPLGPITNDSQEHGQEIQTLQQQNFPKQYMALNNA